MNIERCTACDFALDDSDNFCRRCGAASAVPTLPVVRRETMPSVWQPQVSPVVKGAAVMAAGTVGQFLFRRMLQSVLSRHGGRPRDKLIRVGSPRGRDSMVDEAQIITETIMMRRVRIRRQA